MGLTILFVSLFGGFAATAVWAIFAHLASGSQR
jgi:hypothetical protein